MAQVQNKILKLLKFILISAAFVVLVGSLSFAFLISTKRGHYMSASVVSGILSSRLKTKVIIDTVYFKYKSINLKNFRLYDYKNRILLEAKDVTIRYNKLKIPSNIDFQQLDITDGALNIALYEETGSFNIQLVVDELKSKKPLDEQEDTRLIFRKANLKNVTFTYSRPNRNKNYGKINYDRMVIAGITGSVTNFLLYKGKVTLHVDNIKCTEKSGLRIHHLTTDFSIDSTTMAFRNFYALTNESRLKGSHVMSYNGFPEFDNFESLVKLDTRLDNSIIAFNDLAFFGKAIKTNEKALRITGNATGTLDNLKSKQIQIFFGNESNYSGSFNLSGLPELSETFIDVKLKNSAISFRDITRLVPSATFPAYFYNMDVINVNGTYTGFPNDFVANAFFRTKLGNIKTDLNFKLNRTDNITKYSGNLKLDDFNLGSFINLNNYFGRVSMNGSIAGQGITLNDVKADIDIAISKIDFNKYTYQNINYKGIIAKKSIDGDLTIRDPNIDLDFKGTIDLTQPKPIFSYIASLKNANFQTLNFSKNQMTVSCDMDIKIMANNIDDVEGKILITNPVIGLSDKTHRFDKIEVSSQLLAGLKRIRLTSDIASADMSGNYSLKSIHSLFQSTVLMYFDTSFSRKIKNTFPDNFVDFSVNISQADFINALIPINLSIKDGLYLKGTLNNKRNYLTINGKIPGFNYKKFSLEGINLDVDNKKSRTLHVNFKCNKIFNKDSLIADNVAINGTTTSDLLSFHLLLHNKFLKSKLDLNGQMSLKRDSAELTFTKSHLLANNVEWDLNAQKVKILFKPEIRMPLIELKHKDQSIKLTGVISKDNPDPVRILLDNVNMGDITYYIKNFSNNWGGTINGQVVIYDLLAKPYFDAGMVINPFIYKGTDTLGIVTATSNHNAYTNQTFVQGTLADQNLENLLNVDGYVDLVDKKILDLKFDLQETNIDHFSFFVRGLFSNLKGKISGKMNMTGSVKKPRVEGYADLTKVFFTIDYLKTTYHFSQKIKIDENNVWISNGKIIDAYENPVAVNGVIKHKLFSEYFFDLKIVGKTSFLGMNTVQTDNPFFYGTAFATGNVHISGPIESVHMDLQVRSEKNTKIYLTTYNSSISGQYRFIRFTSKSEKSAIKPEVAPSGFTLNMDMDVTNDADIELIMDPEFNDVIKGNGTGNLKFELDYFGNMNMYGNYFIEKGEYNFTALDVIKRKFTVNSGSTLSWKGDPFDAIVNIEAIYPLEASLYDLVSGDQLPDEVKTAYRQNVPVKAKIFLTESLFSPAVKLDFEVLNTKSISGSNDMLLEQKIRFIKNDEQELNKQVISLLVINRFLPVNTGISAGTTVTEGINTNVGSLISTQVTRWLSELSGDFVPKYFEDFQLGVNYNAETDKYQRQLELALSTSLFNDRIILNGSYDVENITGNFEVNYQLKKGNDKVRLKVFTRSDNNPIYQESIDRQGIGLFFRKEFDNYNELFKKEKPTVPLNN
jgi:hypothetical protein